MKPRNVLFLFLGLLTLLRFGAIGANELSPDESYYSMWAQRPALAYYSKGPGVAVAIRTGMALFGPHEFGVRFLSPLLALATSVLVFYFARRLYNESIAIWTVLTLNSIPIFQVGGVLMTIDPLSIFFWMAALFTFWLALERSPKCTLFWPLTGLLIGLGFLCKYTNAMQLLSVAGVLVFSGRYRRELARPGFYALLGAFAICTLPPIIWNAQHEWITLAHLSARGGLNSAFSLHPIELLEFFAVHFGVYSPFIFAGMLIALAVALRRRDEKQFVLLWFALPLLALYFTLALKHAGEANWTAPAFVSLGVLSVARWHDWSRQIGARRFAIAALFFGVLMSVLTLNTDLVRRAGIPYPYDRDPSARLRGWRTSAQFVQDFRKKFETDLGQPIFLIANKYQTAASLGFYLPDRRTEGPGHPSVYIPESQNIENQFSFWPRYEEFLEVPKSSSPSEDYYTEEQGVNPFLGRSALYVTDRAEERPPTTIKSGFERSELIALYELRRRGQPLRELRVFACYNYRSLPL